MGIDSGPDEGARRQWLVYLCAPRSARRPPWLFADTLLTTDRSSDFRCWRQVLPRTGNALTAKKIITCEFGGC